MLLLYARGHGGRQCEPIRGRTRIMKMVFLFDKEVRRRFNLGRDVANAIPEFTPYNYGPFSAQVFTDLEFLVELELIKVKRIVQGELLPEEVSEYRYWQAGSTASEDDEEPQYEEEFELTPLGRSFVEEELLDQLTQEQLEALDQFKSRCTGTTLRALLRYVYSKYPETTIKSKIRDETLSKYRF